MRWQESRCKFSHESYLERRYPCALLLRVSINLALIDLNVVRQLMDDRQLDNRNLLAFAFLIIVV